MTPQKFYKVHFVEEQHPRAHFRFEHDAQAWRTTWGNRVPHVTEVYGEFVECPKPRTSEEVAEEYMRKLCDEESSTTDYDRLRDEWKAAKEREASNG